MLASLTFDDGFKEHFKIAKRLYEELGIRATFYVITGLENYEGRPLLTKEPNLLGEMCDMGHEVGSHTHTHKNLTLLSEVEVERELVESLDALQEIIGRKPIGLAYPFGLCDRKVINITKKYFKYARIMGKQNRWNEQIDLYRVGSMGVRHLFKLPIKVLMRKDVRLLVLTFHHESLKIIKFIVNFLSKFSTILPLCEALKVLHVLDEP
jgi:peptidoglycan/xylan/chitin deacetylase (PgdA/CDA1 family)